ncbi:MAG: hypothetical protein HY320_12260 [Armatimonadetes bacterium]|nr:hypothetical protein [Armatimonadota bacterium]
MSYRKARRRGISLIELLAALSFATLISTGVVGLSLSASKQWSRDTAKTIADDHISLALQNAVRRISDGKSASVSNGVLYVTMPYVNSNGDYDRFKDGQTFSFSVQNGTLYRTDSNGVKELLGRNIASATFTASSATVGISLTSNKQTGTDQMQASVSSSTTLRNWVE